MDTFSNQNIRQNQNAETLQAKVVKWMTECMYRCYTWTIALLLLGQEMNEWMNEWPLGRPSTKWWNWLATHAEERRMEKAYDDPHRWTHQWLMMVKSTLLPRSVFSICMVLLSPSLKLLMWLNLSFSDQKWDLSLDFIMDLFNPLNWQVFCPLLDLDMNTCFHSLTTSIT
jgi:hypothetical protein